MGHGESQAAIVTNDVHTVIDSISDNVIGLRIRIVRPFLDGWCRPGRTLDLRLASPDTIEPSALEGRPWHGYHRLSDYQTTWRKVTGLSFALYSLDPSEQF